MVSIHRVPVDVLLIISVVCFIFRFKREALHCRSLHVLRPSHCLVCRNEQRRSPTPICVYMTITIPHYAHWRDDTPMAVWQVRHVYNIPTGHLRCFVFDRQFESCEVSERQNQSVVNAFYYVLPHAHPCHKEHFRRRTMTKLRISERSTK